jgi:polyhydroxyalkanoate synthesis regulator phasin
MAKSQIQKLIEAGAEFTDVSRQQADEFVRRLVNEGEVRRSDADELVQTLVTRGKETSEQIAASIQREISKQVAAISARFDDLEGNVEALTEQVTALLNQRRADRPKVAAGASKTQATTKQATKKQATTTEPTKKQATTTKPTKKQATKTKATKKKTKTTKNQAAAKTKAASTEQAAAGRSSAVGPSGVRKVSARRG